MTKRIQIIIADDHPVVRRGLKEIIQEEMPGTEIEEVSDGHELLRRMRETLFDVVILDISMPGLDGLDTLKAIRRERSESRVLVLTIHPEKRYAIRCLKLGADGYLTKESAPGELVNALRKILSGRKYISGSVAEQLTEVLIHSDEEPPHQLLTDREYQVLMLIASGRRLKDIADELHISSKTVSTYRARILEKLRCETTAQLIRYAIHHNLIE